MPRFLAFDIGIKNLAWCCFEKDEQIERILGWDNYNLLSEESNIGVKSKVGKCSYCSAKAAYQANDIFTCVRHCPPTLPALRDVSGNLLKKMPTVADMKAVLNTKGIVRVPTKKADLEEEMKKIASLPIQVKKVSRTPDVGLVEIHDSIKKLVKLQKELWSSCSLILLENQPVFKNPTMKSVQMLLFATLRDLLDQPPPQIKLVHAGKKVKDAAVGDAGYKDRKAGSEARADTFLKNSKLQDPMRWYTIWSKAAKKSDLADALSMCLDASASA